MFLQIKIIAFGLQGDTCTQNNIDVMHVVAVATNKTYGEIVEKFNAKGWIELDFTDDQWRVVEADLNKYHSAEKVQHTIKILRGFQIHSSPEVIESTAVIMLVYT